MSEPSSSASDSEQPTRRKILSWLSRGFLSLWGVAVVYVIGSFLETPAERRRLGERWVEAGTLDTLPIGQARMVRHGRDPVFVVRTGEQALVGLSGVCTHLHCVLAWNDADRTLDCPCHDGVFDLNGNVVTGPPSRSLRTYDVETRLGRIYVRI